MASYRGLSIILVRTENLPWGNPSQLKNHWNKSTFPAMIKPAYGELFQLKKINSDRSGRQGYSGQAHLQRAHGQRALFSLPSILLLAGWGTVLSQHSSLCIQNKESHRSGGTRATLHSKLEALLWDPLPSASSPLCFQCKLTVQGGKGHISKTRFP